MKKILLAVAVLANSLIGAGPAFALQPTASYSTDGSPIVQRITLTGIVPLMRVIYINQAGKIVRVVGNTDQNVNPKVSWNNSHREAQMTPAIDKQYQEILSSNGNHLEAGEAYYPPKLVVTETGAAIFNSNLFKLNLLNLTSI